MSRTAFSTRAPLLLSIQAAGQQLGLSRTSIYRLVCDGTIETVSIGRRKLIVGESLTRYVDQLRESA